MNVIHAKTWLRMLSTRAAHFNVSTNLTLPLSVVFFLGHCRFAWSVGFLFDCANCFKMPLVVIWHSIIENCLIFLIDCNACEKHYSNAKKSQNVLAVLLVWKQYCWLWYLMRNCKSFFLLVFFCGFYLFPVFIHPTSSHSIYFWAIRKANQCDIHVISGQLDVDCRPEICVYMITINGCSAWILIKTSVCKLSVFSFGEGAVTRKS